MLATLSRFPDSRYAPNIVSHVRFTPESSKTTEDAVREGLKKGLVVVVDDIPPSLDHVHDETIGNLDFWRDCMGCNVEQDRDFQGSSYHISLSSLLTCANAHCRHEE